MSIERRWNRNEVSRESPIRKSTGDPPHLKKFRADALKGPIKGLNCDLLEYGIKSGGREEYLVSFLFEAVSAALPAEWLVECRYESTVLTTVTSHVIITLPMMKSCEELIWEAYLRLCDKRG